MKEWNEEMIEKNGKKPKVISGIKHSYMSFKVVDSFDRRV